LTLARKKKKKSTIKSTKKNVHIEKKSNHYNWIPLIRNLGTLVISLIVLYILFHFHKGYQWVYNDLMTNSIELNKRFSYTTYNDRMEAKLGDNFYYLRFLKENTPDNAIIILPPDSVFFLPNSELKFNNLITDIKWSSYFVYPRKLVYENHHKNTTLYRNATHRCILNYYGYQFLPYQVDKQVPITILPLIINQLGQ